jgi:hypothetical protein
LSRPDSVAAYYALALDQTRLSWTRRLDLESISPFIHEKLAEIYESVGRQPMPSGIQVASTGRSTHDNAIVAAGDSLELARGNAIAIGGVVSSART